MFLGLTLGCCVCHDHKFDPVTQREFYQLFGYFGSLTERAMDGNALLPPPTLSLGPPKDEKKVAQLKADIAALETAVKQKLALFDNPANIASLEPRQQAWEREAAKDGRGLPRNVRRLLAVSPTKRMARQKRALREYYIRYIYSGSRTVFDPLNSQLAADRKELVAAEATAPSTLVMQDMPKPREHLRADPRRLRPQGSQGRARRAGRHRAALAQGLRRPIACRWPNGSSIRGIPSPPGSRSIVFGSSISARAS